MPDARRERLNKYMKGRRAELRDRGICVDCQTDPVKPCEPGKKRHVCCKSCLRQRSDRERLRKMTLHLPFPAIEEAVCLTN